MGFYAPYGPIWASLDLLGPTWVSIAFAWLIWASMGLYGPPWASLAVSGQSPKQPTHTHKTHTETFHKLPTTRLHPEKETIKTQTQTIKQATETCHKLLLPITI